MKREFFAGIIFIAFILFTFAPFSVVVRAQEERWEMIASIDFDLQSDGFGFRNYGHDHDGTNNPYIRDDDDNGFDDKTCCDEDKDDPSVARVFNLQKLLQISTQKFSFKEKSHVNFR